MAPVAPNYILGMIQFITPYIVDFFKFLLDT